MRRAASPHLLGRLPRPRPLYHRRAHLPHEGRDDHFEFGWEMGRSPAHSPPARASPIPSTAPAALPHGAAALSAAARRRLPPLRRLHPASGWVVLTGNSAFSAATALAIYRIASRCFTADPRGLQASPSGPRGSGRSIPPPCSTPSNGYGTCPSPPLSSPGSWSSLFAFTGVGDDGFDGYRVRGSRTSRALQRFGWRFGAAVGADRTVQQLAAYVPARVRTLDRLAGAARAPQVRGLVLRLRAGPAARRHVLRRSRQSVGHSQLAKSSTRSCRCAPTSAPNSYEATIFSNDGFPWMATLPTGRNRARVPPLRTPGRDRIQPPAGRARQGCHPRAP